MSQEQEITQVDFSGLILGFSSAALSYLGVEIEGQPQAAKNLPLAKQNIGIIELLEEKTKGNLSEQEQKLVTHILTDLRMRYVDASKE